MPVLHNSSLADPTLAEPGEEAAPDGAAPLAPKPERTRRVDQQLVAPKALTWTSWPCPSEHTPISSWSIEQSDEWRSGRGSTREEGVAPRKGIHSSDSVINRHMAPPPMRAGSTPEEALWLAVLRLTFQDLRSPSNRLRNDALAWVTSDDPNAYEVSFSGVCEIFSIDPSWAGNIARKTYVEGKRKQDERNLARRIRRTQTMAASMTREQEEEASWAITAQIIAKRKARAAAKAARKRARQAAAIEPVPEPAHSTIAG